MSGPPGTRPLSTHPDGAGDMRGILRERTANSVCEVAVASGETLSLEPAQQQLRIEAGGPRLVLERCDE